MLNNAALDIFIGLVFVYLLYSLLATIVLEIISSTLNLRAVVLVKALRVMLEDRVPRSLKSTTPAGKLLERIIIYLRKSRHYITCHLPDATLAKAFYKHPGVKYLSSNILRTKPSYIEPENFSSTLVKILRGKNYKGYISEMQEIYNTLFPLTTDTREISKTSVVEVGLVDPLLATIQPETLDQLRQIYMDADKDIDRFKTLLEKWFNETMDRANGWYKRQTKNILFVVGLLVAIWGNVDTLKIYSVLSKDKSAREQMVELAINSQPKYSDAISNIRNTTAKRGDTLTTANLAAQDSLLLNKTYNYVQNDIENSSNVLGMGWHTSANYKIYDSLLSFKQLLKDSLKNNSSDTSLFNKLRILSDQSAKLEEKVYDRFNGFRSILGWVITALALTLGAPFWFDLLKKFISIRATGVTPKENAEKLNKTTDSSAVSTAGTRNNISGTVLDQNDDQPELVRDEAADSSIAQG